MSLGTHLGPYEILAPIGAGGMGEVYKARDTRLDRIVAIKTSKEQFTERFDREARAVAALNHPNICHLYDVGPNYLVMEYVEGPTLAERISTGPIPIAEALATARQIAEALEAAHEKGIVHRDLKPANIKLTPEGKVKVLDFGLAKAFESSTTSSGGPTNSPTLTLASTRAGVILGTAAYMSPEQARGIPADKRADIWSFGVVLFEMLTGRDTFTGPTVSDTLAAVLRADLQWSSLPIDTPAAVRRLLQRCLVRDRNNRLHDIADARLELDEPPEPPSVSTPQPRGPSRWWRAAAAVPVLAFLLLAIVHFREAPEVSVQSSLLPPEKSAFTPMSLTLGGTALSPDGRTLAFLASQEGRNLIWVRRLDSIAARPLPGTENAYTPFWSPDGRFLGFFAEGKLKKIEVAGGPPQVLCQSNFGRGGTWNREGTIVFSGLDRGIYRVPATGGEPVKVTALDPASHESAHYWPTFLPDGRHFLYLARTDNREKDALCVGSVDARPASAKRIEVMKTAADAFYVPAAGSGIWPMQAGWLLFLRETTLFAQRVDPKALRLEGEAVPVVERVGYLGNIGYASFSVSQNGVLAYGHESNLARRLVWMSRDGKPAPIVAEQAFYVMPRLSPDGARLATMIVDAQTGNADIWQIDLAHGITTRFTFDPASDVFPVWSPDGRQIVFSSTRAGPAKLYLKTASGTGNEEKIGSSGPAIQWAFDWSRDGRHILYSETTASAGYDLWTLPAAGERKPVPFLQTPFNETQGQFSPDGRWVAYSSDESGRYEIYVRSFGGTPAKFQISQNGGMQPRWRGDGKELYYLSPDGKMMAVSVKETAEAVERGTPQVLFEDRSLSGATGAAFFYDVTRDGQRFLIVATAEGNSQPLTLVTNWQAGLKK